VRDPVLLFNVGALRDDVGRKLESIEACGRAIRTDPAMANCQLPIATATPFCSANTAAAPRKANRHVVHCRRQTGSRSV